MDAIIERAIRIKQRLESKGLALNRPLSLKKIESFESQYRLILPDEYRIFLQFAGDGGAGPPYYGLQPLAAIPDDMYPNAKASGKLPDVTKPFPFTEKWIWEANEISLEGDETQIEHGNLCLGTEGCGMYWHLITTGAERGTMWFFSGEGICPTSPSRTFLKWYEDWLDGNPDWWGSKQS